MPVPSPPRASGPPPPRHDAVGAAAAGETAISARTSDAVGVFRPLAGTMSRHPPTRGKTHRW